MDETMTSTTFSLDGYHIVESLGVVRGVTVRSRSLLAEEWPEARRRLEGMLAAYGVQVAEAG